ncbi:DMT family transporter [Histidinibacterium lentulum]|nr:DMT family transporter [Histidinibacterium lentulum]
MTVATASRHTPLAAILVMCAGVATLVMSDVAAKWLVERYHPLQILWVRSLLACPVVAAIVIALQGPSGLASARVGVHAVRALLAVAATWAFILSLRYMALDAATSLIFAAPLFVAALSRLVLGEAVSRDRWIAILAGFLGVLIVVRPGAAAFEPAALLALAAAAIYALLMLVARRIPASDGFGTMTFWITAFPILFCLPWVFVPWPEVEPLDLLLFPATALCGTLGISLLSQAFRMAEASVVAPFDYTALFWASLMGWIVWGTVPSPWTWAGAAVIAAGGVYLLRTERRARARARL